MAEDEYVTHLERAHGDELHGLDRRLVDERTRSAAPRNRKPYVFGLVVLVLFGTAYLAILLMPPPVANTAAQQPNTDESVHIHGDLLVQYDDTVMEFDDPQYIEQDGCFHFHAHDHAEVWHVHCEDVTLEYALLTLGLDVSDEGLLVDGERVAESDDTTVSVTVDGEPVDPEHYVLEDGNDVRVIAETSD